MSNTNQPLAVLYTTQCYNFSITALTWRNHSPCSSLTLPGKTCWENPDGNANNVF